MFLLAPGIDPLAVAAADMGEVQVELVVEHRGSSRKRLILEFKVN